LSQMQVYPDCGIQGLFESYVGSFEMAEYEPILFVDHQFAWLGGVP